MGNRRGAFSATWLALLDVDLWRLRIRFCFTIHSSSVGYFGVVRLRDGKFFFYSEKDKFNGVTFFVFLKALYRVSTTGSRRVVVIADNARYHYARLYRNWREEHVNRLVLDYLPLYSLDLNKIERVWKLTRRQCLHKRYFILLSEVTD